MSDRTSSSRTVLQLDEYLLRKKRGFATSFIELVTPGGRVAGVWAKPRRLVRGFLAVLLAPSAFLGTMILGFWLFGALENDPQRHAASQDPDFWAMVRGGAWAISVWMLANGLLIMILAAFTLGVVAIPGAISKRGGHYSLWIQDAKSNLPAKSIGLAICLRQSDSMIHILLEDPKGLSDRDRLLVLSLSVALWLS